MYSETVIKKVTELEPKKLVQLRSLCITKILQENGNLRAIGKVSYFLPVKPKKDNSYTKTVI